MEPEGRPHAKPGLFPVTRHSVLERLASGDAESRARARDAVAAAYWNPLYKYLRLRWRLAPEDAEDLVQGFFAVALDQGWLERFDPARARFRTFLRVCADRFVSNQREAAARQKRGGGVAPLRLDFASAERELAAITPAVHDDPDAWFQREFARALCARAVARTRAELEADGRAAQFELFARRDLADVESPPSYAELAAATGTSVTQVTNHLHAVRKRFREHVLAELRAATASEDEYRAEARDLLGIEWP